MRPHFPRLARFFLLITALVTGIFASNPSFARSFGPVSRSEKQSNVQFSLSTSSDDLNVYGNVTLSELVPSDTSYKIAITVTSPSGRTNTTESDWSKAPFTYSSGLSFGVESGIYSVQATYIGRTGTYDEYGNFSPTGQKTTGSTFGTYRVLPVIAIASVNPTSIVFDRNSQSPRQSSARLSLSAEIPAEFSLPVYGRRAWDVFLVISPPGT